jgi:hypothetical protein
VPRQVLRHRIQVAGLRAAPFEIAVLQVRGRDLERVADPLPRREAGPAVRCPGGWMGPAVHEHRAIERAHELNVIDRDLARQRVLLLEDARAAEPAPLVRRRMRAALVFRCAPDRLGARICTHATGVVEGNPEIVAERRLAQRPEGAGLFVVLEPPFAGNVGWGRRPRGLRERRRAQQHGRGEEHQGFHNAKL